MFNMQMSNYATQNTNNENVKHCVTIIFLLNCPCTKGKLLSLNFSQHCLQIRLAEREGDGTWQQEV